MILGVYATLGVFLIMGLQALTYPQHIAISGATCSPSSWWRGCWAR
jgi:hypothetical protein